MVKHIMNMLVVEGFKLLNYLLKESFILNLLVKIFLVPAYDITIGSIEGIISNLINPDHNGRYRRKE
jgi:hypothetical protein